jgi:hypothetical protein
MTMPKAMAAPAFKNADFIILIPHVNSIYHTKIARK